MMKKILYLLLLALMPMCFTACGGDGDGDGSNLDSRLYGVWYQEETYDIIAYKFESNGDFYYNEWMKGQEESVTKHDPGRWSVSGNLITLVQTKNGKTKDNTYRYEITSDGKTLYFYRQDENGDYTRKGDPYIKQE